MAQEEQGLATAISLLNQQLGVSHSISRFDGDPNKFREWMKEIEKYAIISQASSDKIKKIAYQASSGAVSDYIQRYLINNAEATWQQLKADLTMRFGDVTDPQHALRMLRDVRQKKGENVQCYAERMLFLAEQGFTGQPGGFAAVERQLIGYFTDGLYYDYLQFKIMRENPSTLVAAIAIAVNEQNLRKRFNLRVGRDITSPPQTRNEQPMEVDQVRPTRKCQYCFKKGHTARYCRKIARPQQPPQPTYVQAVKNNQETREK